MAYIVVDVEANGPYPPTYSLLSIGAVNADNPTQTFYAEMRPISDNFIPEAYAVSQFTHEQAMGFEDSFRVITRFAEWLKTTKGRPMFVSDTTSFDFAFVNYYMWQTLGENPFGHSSTSIKDLYKGLLHDFRANHRKLRKTKHSHHALDDAMGNAEAFNAIRERMKP